MTSLFASRNSQTCHVPKTVKILTKCFQYMQDLNLNIGTPIFKIRILAQLESRDFFK